MELTDSLSGFIEQGKFQYLITDQFNVTSSIDYKMIDNQVNINEASLRREKSKFLPTISGFYQHQEQTNAAAFNFQPKDIRRHNCEPAHFHQHTKNVHSCTGQIDT